MYMCIYNTNYNIIHLLHVDVDERAPDEVGHFVSLSLLSPLSISLFYYYHY